MKGGKRPNVLSMMQTSRGLEYRQNVDSRYLLKVKLNCMYSKNN